VYLSLNCKIPSIHWLLFVCKNAIYPSSGNLLSLWYRRSPDKRANNSPVFTQLHPRVTSWSVWENSFSTLGSWGGTWSSTLITHRQSHPLIWDSCGIIQVRRDLRSSSSPNFCSKQGQLGDKIRFLRAFHRRDLFLTWDSEQLWLKRRLRGFACLEVHGYAK